MIIALAITGPTASGKTALSLDLAEKFGCEIISCDSMQIYSGMNIGTAKAAPAERERVRHHMIDLVPPTEKYSVSRYRDEASACAKDIAKRGKLPLFVGGTGLYIDSLMRGEADSVPESDSEYREKILSEIKTDEDRDRLYSRLCEVDPQSALATHKNNLKRVIRALEIYDKTGKPKSYFDRETRLAVRDFDIRMITLDFHNRENLYKRVDERVEQMLDAGLVDEARELFERGYLEPDSTANQAIGYKELVPYLEGEATLDDCKAAIKLATRRYAKRQLTWFRHEGGAERLYLDDGDGILLPYDAVRDKAYEIAKKLINEENANIC